MPNALVVFTPSGKRGEFPVGTPLLQCAQKLGVDIDSVCGGRGICGRCKIIVAEGKFAKYGITSLETSLSKLSEPEIKFKTRKVLKPGYRLSCHTLLLGNTVIDVPAESQVHKQIVRKRPEARKIEMDPAIRLYYVDVDPPQLDNPLGDFERLVRALQIQWNLTNLFKIDIRPLAYLQETLRKENWKVTVAIHGKKRIIKIWPGFQNNAYGIAFDIGSTTIAGHLCNLATGEVLATTGIMNPQIRFGEDLMSRVSFVMLNPDGKDDLTNTVRSAINSVSLNLSNQANIDKNNILNLTFVGNPIMHHLLLGIDPSELGGAPFALAVNSGMTLWATELNITEVSEDARAYLLPCIAGHVGADTAAVILSEGPHLQKDISLIVDVGTNAEIVLGNKDRLLVASSPTGPAFEGAQVSCGQRAAAGAIERVRIDKKTLKVKFKVIGCDKWSDQSDFFQQTQSFGITGICGSGIIEALAEMYLAGILLPDGTINGEILALSDNIYQEGRTFSYRLYSGEPNIYISQNDVRAIQLAKAALYAGTRLLMDKMGVETVDKIILAGAFGSNIDPKYAMILGMIPDCEIKCVSSAGNAAGTGARIALLNENARDEIEQTVSRIEKIETATEPLFQKHFIDAMTIPHKLAPMPNLESLVELPSQVYSPSNQKVRRKSRKHQLKLSTQ